VKNGGTIRHSGFDYKSQTQKHNAAITVGFARCEKAVGQYFGFRHLEVRRNNTTTLFIRILVLKSISTSIRNKKVSFCDYIYSGFLGDIRRLYMTHLKS
jgi:hypothetical protein